MDKINNIEGPVMFDCDCVNSSINEALIFVRYEKYVVRPAWSLWSNSDVHCDMNWSYKSSFRSSFDSSFIS